MTWRKAYHIHNWFVENVQDGKDDGAMYRIPDGKLKELFKACDHVLLTGKLVAGTVKHIEFNGKHPGGTSISEPAMVLKDDAIARSYFHCPGGKWGVCPQYDSKFFEEIHATWLWLSEVIRELDDGTSDGIYYYAR